MSLLSSASSKGGLRRLMFSTMVLLSLLLIGVYALHQDINLNLMARRHAPSMEFWFGTDSLGRDLWLRCLQGMMTSLQIGGITALFSGIIALLIAIISQINTRCDLAMRTLIDAFIALPHLLLLILICFTFGGGKWGVILAISLTHWPKLALILRSELIRISHADYIVLARRIGNSSLYLLRYHYLPLLLPQLVVGALLIFPHAVLHSASLSFLGFGLAPHEASLGLLLSDALGYLTSGDWWLAFYPGITLMVLVLTIDQMARCLQRLWVRCGE